MTTPDERWMNDAIQFPRLLAEINATWSVSEEDFNALCESMDLDPGDIDALFERAHVAWELAKREIALEAP